MNDASCTRSFAALGLALPLLTACAGCGGNSATAPQNARRSQQNGAAMMQQMNGSTAQPAQGQPPR